MSDETPPPPLRLKPRQRPETETPEAAAPAAASATEAGKLRLKPKLSAEIPEPAAAAPAPADVPAEPAPPAGERVRLKPKLNVEPAQAAESAPAEEAPQAGPEDLPPPPMPEQGKGKLKIKLGGAAPAETAPAPAGAAGEETPPAPSAPPPFPVLLAPMPELAEGLETPDEAPRTAGLTRPGIPGRTRSSIALARERRMRLLKYLMIAVGGVALAAGVILLVQLKLEAPPPTPGIPTRPASKPVEATVAPVTPLPVAETPAPEAVSAEPAPEPAVTVPVKRPPAVHEKSAVASATSELAPGITVTTDSVEAVPDANAAFRTFVANAKISGVFQGSPPRAFINGRLIRAGETIDASLGIRFESVDQSAKNIIFKDASGATVSRHY